MTTRQEHPPTTPPAPPPPTTTRPAAPTTTPPAAPTTTTTTPHNPPTSEPPSASPSPSPSPQAPAAFALITASARIDCRANSVLVLLGNAGSRDATVDVALPLSEVRSGISVAGGSNVTSTLAIGELNDGITEIRISDSVTGKTYARTPVDVDCEAPPHPRASAVLDCVAEVVIIHLRNDAGDPALLTVLHERVEFVAEIELAAGEVAEVEILLNGAEAVPVRVVDIDGNDLLRVEIDNVCEPFGLQDDPAGDGDSGTPASVDPGLAGFDCPSVGLATDGYDCGTVDVVVDLDCVSSSAEVSVRRDGVGSERFVVLVDGNVAGVLAIDGSGEGTVPVALTDGSFDLLVSRSQATAPAVVATLVCEIDGGVAGLVAASLVVFAVLASMAGALSWRSKLG